MTCRDHCQSCSNFATCQLYGERILCGQCSPVCPQCGKDAACVPGYDGCVECVINVLYDQSERNLMAHPEIFAAIVEVREWERAQ